MKEVNSILIAGITPYFLKRGSVWFEENEKSILKTRKAQGFFKDNTFMLEKDQQFILSEFLRALDELGYEKVLHTERMGEFSHLGGMIDVFPINSKNAFRIEFLGNKVESIEELDVRSDDEEKERKILQNRLKSQRLFSDLKGIKQGDYIVHLDHGIARFHGIEIIQDQEYYELLYAAKDKLFVPKGLERKLSLYVGFTQPKISRLASPLWIKTKRRIREDVEKTAKELLAMYAQREVSLRPPYDVPDEIEKKLEHSFEYQETPDQLQVIQEIEQDLKKDRPMDRIVCGDVGFGKTEIALRTAVRAAGNGYQAALISPTTILAYQHFQTFKERLKGLPIQTALISRLQTKKEQKHILEKLSKGATDIIIGTHRLLSKDVEFRNLGLLIIDDEQRFGVTQKEKFRTLKSSIDVLSLSATPIPRTLYMALSSLRNISTLQTPPEGRIAVEVHILPRKEQTIKKAIEQELKRKGQVYYLHNRIGTIGQVKKYLEGLLPNAKIKVAHGRLKAKELVRIMDEFAQGKFNVLLATTIIENGLDIPEVNTIIVDNAAKLGLSQAYQIKGRVGRSFKKAYAYFLYGGKLKGKARLRLKALKQAEELGSGYRLALRDMEIRGAGNILGKEQSGSVNAVGLNLYCQMLSESVERLKNKSG